MVSFATSSNVSPVTHGSSLLLLVKVNPPWEGAFPGERAPLWFPLLVERVSDHGSRGMIGWLAALCGSSSAPIGVGVVDLVGS